MLTNRIDIPMYKTEEGRLYCLFSDIDPRIREAIHKFAWDRGETFTILDEEACWTDTIEAFSAVTISRKVMA